MKTICLIFALLAAQCTAFASTAPAHNTPKNFRLVAVGTCVFEDEYSFNDKMYSPEFSLRPEQGFRRLAVSNVQTGEFFVSRPFALYQWGESTLQTPIATIQPERFELDIAVD